MGFKLTFLAAVLGVLFAGIVVSSVRSSSMRPTLAWLWLSMAGFLVSVPLLAPVYKWVSSVVMGVDDARTLIYMALLGFLLVFALYMTLKVSAMSDRIQELISHTAILESRIEGRGAGSRDES